MHVFALYGSERNSAEPSEARTYLVAAASESEACRCVPVDFIVSNVVALKGIKGSILVPTAVAWVPGQVRDLLP